MLMWFLIGVALLIIELTNYGLISIWFAFGAFITMFFTHLDIQHQFYLFVIVSTVLLFLIRKTALEKLKGKEKETNRMINSTVKIMEIKDNGNYTVYSEGKYWDCISESKLEINDLATVKKIEGNKLILEPIIMKED